MLHVSTPAPAKRVHIPFPNDLLEEARGRPIYAGPGSGRFRPMACDFAAENLPRRPAVPMKKVIRPLTAADFEDPPWPTVANMSPGEAALAYARAGFHIFPARPDSKKPHVKAWPVLATNDPRQIEAWWRQWPNAMIGFPTGAANGVFVVDCDVKDGVNGLHELQKFAEQHDPDGLWLEGVCARTPSGGVHLYFKVRSGVKVRVDAKDIAPCVDSRGHHPSGEPNGYVIAPGSRRADGRRYEWDNADADMWALKPAANSEAQLFGAGSITEAPLWLHFFLMFGKSERERLAGVGIRGWLDFKKSEAPETWETEASERLQEAAPARNAAKPSANAPLDRPLTPEQIDRAIRYVRGVITRECAIVGRTEKGSRDDAVNKAALRINARLKGLDAIGVDSSELAALAEDLLTDAASECGIEAEHPGIAADKLSRSYENARPHDMLDIARGADPADEFDAIDPGLLAPASRPAARQNWRLKFAKDISTAAILAREQSALVRGFMYRRDIGVLFAPPGTGKTFVGLDLATWLARGLGDGGTPAEPGNAKWCGRRIASVPVLYVGLEGAGGVEKRLHALAEAYGDPGARLAALELDVFTLAQTAGGAGEGKSRADRGVTDIADAAKVLGEAAGEPVGLIILDTVARAIAGDDENAQNAMSHLVDKVQAIARATGAAVLLVHHTNKAGDMRGSSVLEGACDFILRAEADATDAGLRRLIVTKAKDGEAGPLCNYRLEQRLIALDDDGEPITSCILAKSPPTPAKSAPGAKAKGAGKGGRAMAAALAAIFEAAPLDASGDAVVPLDKVRAAFDAQYGPAKPDALRRAWKRALEELPAGFGTEDREGGPVVFVMPDGDAE